MRQLHLQGKLLAGDGVQFHFDIGRRQRAAFQGAPQLVGVKPSVFASWALSAMPCIIEISQALRTSFIFWLLPASPNHCVPREIAANTDSAAAPFPISAGEHQDLCLLRWGFGPRHRGIDIGHRWLKFPQQRDGLPGLRQANGAHLAIDRLRLTGGRDLRQYLKGGLAVGETY